MNLFNRNTLVKNVKERQRFVKAFGCRMNGDEILQNGTVGEYIKWLNVNKDKAPYRIFEK